MRSDAILTVLVISVSFKGLLTAEEWHWGYEGDQGPSYWHLHYEDCGGQKQSPVDVPFSELVYDSSHGPIQFRGYDSGTDGSYRLHNNGHTVQMDVTNGQHAISGGRLPGQYKLEQLHFHWGDNNNKGSEHLLNGRQYPLEMHLVHYNSKYNNVGEAKDYPDGVAVVGIMFEVGGEMNEGLDNIVRKLDMVKYKDQSTTVPTFPLADLFPDDPENYFRYSGSLTTPPCSETVVWTVLSSPVTISQSQIDKFREILEGAVGEEEKVLVNNYRYIQPLFGRTIYSSFKAPLMSEATSWHWGYKNKAAPSYWPMEYEECAGRRQSPVDIPLSETVFDPTYGRIELAGYDSIVATNFRLRNTGHSIQVDIIDGNYTIFGGKLSSQYRLAQFHFHWGATDARGSEHLINGHQYPMEMHLVHYNSQYDGVSDAAKYPDGIVVLGVMFEIEGQSNAGLDNIVQKLDMVQYKEQAIDIDVFPPTDILAIRTEEYFTYNGSLTTPGCSETVQWVVFKEKVKISQSQIDQFRKVYEDEEGKNEERLVDNYRPPQPLYGRSIYSNFKAQSGGQEEAGDKMNEVEHESEWHWGYRNKAAPSYWPIKYDECAGQRQSPIDIPLSETVFDPSYGSLQFEGYNSNKGGKFLLHNNGHSAQVDIINGSYTISGGRLPSRYKLAQFHFHWGANNTKGSEHLINGVQYPLEMHLVHYDSQYEDLSEAVGYPDGIVVLGVMFEIGEESHAALNNIVQNLDMVRYKEQKVEINSLPLEQILPMDSDKYFTYSGSLTTPGCSETVQWIVFNDAVKISQAQIEKFRKMYANEAGEATQQLVNNFRPAQPLSGRLVYSNFPVTESSPGKDMGEEEHKGAEEWHWGYEEKAAPDYWLLKYEQCAGRRQSPIDIPISEVVYDATYGPMQFKGYNSVEGVSMKLHNNGHSVQVDIVSGDYIISGGKLPAQYRLVQFHFHWGAENTMGSEHLVNGYQYPLEVHLVHYNSKYGDLSEAARHPDGIAVLAILYEIGYKMDPALNNIVKKLPEIRYKEQATEIDAFRLDGLLPKAPQNYFRYRGSLTTPPCSETVVWTVFKNPVMISQSQIDEFRTVYEGRPGEEKRHLVNNFREPQPRFGRSIYSSFSLVKRVNVNELSSAYQASACFWSVALASVFSYCKANF